MGDQYVTYFYIACLIIIHIIVYYRCISTSMVIEHASLYFTRRSH